VQELGEALAYGSRTGTPVQVFAGGSNVVFADEGFDGLVIHVALRGVTSSREGDAVVVTAAAGEPWDPLVARATESGWGGIECLSGIPGSVGATPVQNVGAYGQEVRDTITCVRALDRTTGGKVDFTPDECRFSYRQSRFKSEDADRFIITEVRFRLRPEGSADIRYAELKAVLEAGVDLGSLRPGAETLAAIRGAVIGLRRKKSMVFDPADENSKSVGSFFVNPVVPEATLREIEQRWQGAGGTTPVPRFPAPRGVKVPAGWLVEHAGYVKGYRKGGAGVSENHALALVNRGGTAKELTRLASDIQQAVLTKFGVQLEREPVYVPFRP
jgi:UDP-N-acetylmuramate dehydrogenase